MRQAQNATQKRNSLHLAPQHEQFGITINRRKAKEKEMSRVNKPIFKTKRSGWFGPLRLGPDYMESVERRAQQIEAACGETVKDRRQMLLPFGKEERKCK